MRVSQVTGPRTSAVIEEADPVPGDRQLLVEVVASGVCTSDLSVWRTGGRASGAPVRLGHEIVGRIVATGPLARGWSAGDLVTGLGGQGFASLAVLEADRVLPVPDGIDPALAIGEPVADLAEALSRTHMGAGDRVAVVGLGFMGLGLVQLVRDRAPGLLVGVDPVPAARQRALDLGADLVFAPAEVPAEYGGPGNGAGAAPAGRAGDHRVDIVLEATGVTSGLTTASALVRPFGTLCVVGYHHAGDAMMDMDLWYKGATIVNGFCPEQPRLMRAMSDALDLIARHRFSYAPLVTHRFGLADVDRAFALMDARADGFVKAVLLPG
ncbi:MAG TPA: alcohol dehydrogenase catalytic domain-containing protein [Trebonia sp.]|jgi:L-iditol 2-dehydrogenase|nr:alcohol dehydrogenase catalytic domain-containing protein [Trebonia sp.]